MTSNTDLVISAEARSNIQDIYHYTSGTWGERQADGYEKLLNDAFLRIRAFPEIGHVSGEDPRIREFHLEHHTILYHHDPGIVIILRVINPRRLCR